VKTLGDEYEGRLGGLYEAREKARAAIGTTAPVQPEATGATTGALSERGSALCNQVARLHDPESRSLDDLPGLVHNLSSYLLHLESRS